MKGLLFVEVYDDITRRNECRAHIVELSESSRAVTMVDGLPHAASPGKFGLPSNFVSKVACRVVRTLSTYSKSNTLAEAGTIECQLVLRLFVNFCHKNGDIFFDSRAIVMKVVVHQE